MELKATDTPDEAAPADSSTGAPPNDTAYLKINLKNLPQNQTPMTAVFVPDPKGLGTTVDVLLWFHGHKGMLGNLNLSGYSAQKYLNVAQFQLRQFINRSSKKNFILVVPTLGDVSEAGLLEQADEANAFMQQVLNGANKYLGTKIDKIGEIVLGAHSGGGKTMGHVALFPDTQPSTSGVFDNVDEIWCVDCTYGWGDGHHLPSGQAFKSWAANPGHAHHRLFVFSTGEFASFKLPTSGPKGVTPGPANPAVGFWGTGNEAKVVYDFAKSSKSSFIQVRINQLQVKDDSKPDKETNYGSFEIPSPFPHGNANEHNQSVGFYFTKLIDSSTILT